MFLVEISRTRKKNVNQIGIILVLKQIIVYKKDEMLNSNLK